MDASHVLSPITSVQRRNSAIVSAFVRPLYNGIVGFPHGVFYMVSVRSLAFAYHRRRYFKSTHFVIKVVACLWCW